MSKGNWGARVLVALGLTLGVGSGTAGASSSDAAVQAAARRWQDEVAERMAASPRARDRLLARWLGATRGGAMRLSPLIDAAEAAALQRLLQDAHDDPLVWWLVAQHCPAQAAHCDAAQARARLRAIDGDNGAVWWLGLDADGDGDGIEAETRLRAVARAARFDVYDGEFLRTVLDGAAAVELPVEVLEAEAAPDQVPSAERVRFIYAMGVTMALVLPRLSPPQQLCTAPDTPAHRSGLCLQALRRQLGLARNLLVHGAASGALLRLLPEGEERDALIASRRTVAWQAASWNELLLRDEAGFRYDPARFDAAVAAWRVPGADEFDVMRAGLDAAGVAPQPPPGWGEHGPGQE